MTIKKIKRTFKVSILLLLVACAIFVFFALSQIVPFEINLQLGRVLTVFALVVALFGIHGVLLAMVFRVGFVRKIDKEFTIEIGRLRQLIPKL